ncbi:MAG: hypothetical protein IJ584_14710 [Bacteroidales bacterium]|nr:hypothetical protein [Bacteroidales bacterium]
MKWEIVDKESANKFGLRIIPADGDQYLEVKVENIPKGMEIYDFLQLIQKTGIVVCENPSRKERDTPQE